MKKGKHSTRSVLGIKSFSRNGIQSDGHGEIVYFLVKPTNISVLSRSSVRKKIEELVLLLTLQPDLEIICLDARENFEDNKHYLDARLEEERDPRIRDLLGRDKAFLDEIQTQMTTAREFLFAVRLRNDGNEQSFSLLNRIEQNINDRGFSCTRAEKADIKRILCRYFGIETFDRQLDDHDGDSTVENWSVPD